MKIWYLIFLLILAIIFIPANSTTEEIDIVGSTSIQPVCEELANEYMKSHPDVDINIQGGGSGLAIRSINSNIADIGMCSKEVDNITKYELGSETIVIVVNKNNPISNLSKNQVKDIFSGKTTNWNQLNGSNGKIDVISREVGSGTLDVFNSEIMNDSPIREDAIIQNSQGSIMQAVETNPNAIAFISDVNLDDDLKVIKGDFEIKRPFLLLTTDNPSPQTQDFIKWIDENGSDILASKKVI